MFLYHAMALPHTPFVATPEEPEVKSNLDRHKAMVRSIDKQVGRLVAAIDELGLLIETERLVGSVTARRSCCLMGGLGHDALLFERDVGTLSASLQRPKPPPHVPRKIHLG